MTAAGRVEGLEQLGDGLEEFLSLVTEWLICASSQVGGEYFQLPVAGAEEEAEYRERVYCYELYHRWRSHWPDGFPFSLNGEVDKSGHPIIEGRPKPDFVVHVPGSMTDSSNLLIVEVKPANAALVGMHSDLKKLTTFRRDLVDGHGRPANYAAAYFWLYGISLDKWPEFRKRLLKQLEGSQEFDRTLVSCCIHEQPGTRAIQVPWE